MNKRHFVKELFKGGTHPEQFSIGDRVVQGHRAYNKLHQGRGIFECGDEGKIVTLFTTHPGCNVTEKWAGVRATTGKHAGKEREFYLREITHLDEADLPPCRTCGRCPYTERSQ